MALCEEQLRVIHRLCTLETRRKMESALEWPQVIHPHGQDLRGLEFQVPMTEDFGANGWRAGIMLKVGETGFYAVIRSPLDLYERDLNGRWTQWRMHGYRLVENWFHHHGNCQTDIFKIFITIHDVFTTEEQQVGYSHTMKWVRHPDGRFQVRIYEDDGYKRTFILGDQYE